MGRMCFHDVMVEVQIPAATQLAQELGPANGMQQGHMLGNELT